MNIDSIKILKKHILLTILCFLFIPSICISQSNCSLVINNQINVSCYGGYDGSLVLSGTGGTGFYNYVLGIPIFNGSIIPFANTGSGYYATPVPITNIPANCYTAIISDSLGCSDTTTICVTQPDSIYSITNMTQCNQVIWNFNLYNSSGTYSSTLTAANGCDSTAILNVTLIYSDTSYSNVSACDSYIWNGSTYTSSGTYQYVTNGSNNCDSVAILNLTINNSSTNSASITACSSYDWAGNTYTSSGLYTNVFSDENGCDSTVNLNLTINYPDTLNLYETACDSFEWNGNWYSSSGVYYNILSSNCDSAEVLNLTINSNDTSYSSVTSCDSLFWNGIWYTSSGIYSFSSVSNSFSLAFDGVNDFVDVQDNSTLLVDELTISFDVLIENIGSDMAFVTKMETNANNEQFYCGLTSLGELHFGVKINSNCVAGSGWELLTSSTSLVTNQWYHLTYQYDKDVMKLFIDGIMVAQNNIINDGPIDNCIGGSLNFGKNWNGDPDFFDGKLDNVQFWNIDLSSSQILAYKDSPPSGNESGLVGFWNFEEGIGNTVYDQTLNNNSGSINGPIFDASVPNFSYQLTASTGCDSTAILNLIINQADSSYTSVSACDSFTWNNITYSQSGTYFSNIGSINNFSMNFDGSNDYIDCGQATSNNILSNNATWMAWVKCDNLNTPQVITSKWVSGSNTQWAFGRFHQNNQSGEFYLTLRGSNGSYNSHFSSGFNLQPNEWSHISIVWDQDSLYFYKNGVFLNAEYTGQYNLNQTSGNLLIGAQNNSPQEYFWDGKLDDIQIWNKALTQQEIQNYINCPPHNNEIGLVRYWNFEEGVGNQIIDQSSSGINGVLYGSSWSSDIPFAFCGLININGCDSVAVLNLTINSSDTSVTSITACDSLEWNGAWYTASGTFYSSFLNQNNCDSVAVLNLTINQSDTSISNITACDSYFWGDSSYTQTGTYYSNTFSNNNYSLNFNGNGDHAQLSNIINFGQSSFTISIDCYLNAFDGSDNESYSYVVGTPLVSSNNDHGFKIQTASTNLNGGFEAHINDAGTTNFNVISYNNSSQNNIVLNRWYNLSMVVDRNTNNFQFYVDGNLVGSQTISSSFGDVDAGVPISIGHMSLNNTSLLNGFTDNLHIWSKPLSQTEVQKYISCPPTGSETDLIGFWNFEEGVGTTTYNQTNNANDITLSGANFDSNVPVKSCQLINSNGCDSTAVLNLTINQSDTSTTVVVACDSFSFGNQTYTQSGIYYHSFTADSLNGFNYVGSYNGSLYYISENPDFWNTAKTNCIANGGNLVCISDLDENNFVSNILPGQQFWIGYTDEAVEGNFIWVDGSGNTYTKWAPTEPSNSGPTGNEDYTLINSGEGGSNPLDGFWNDVDDNLNQYFYVLELPNNYLTTNGCDSVIALDLTINQSDSIILNISACDSYLWDGVTYTTSGQYSNTYTNYNNCDSTVILNLTINYSINDTLIVSACDNYLWDGVNYNTSGQYVNIYNGSNNCDSIVTLNLTINNSDTSYSNIIACDSVEWNGTWYDSSGTYFYNIIGSNISSPQLFNDSLLIDQFTMTASSYFAHTMPLFDSTKIYRIFVDGRYGYADGWSHNDPCYNYAWDTINGIKVNCNGNQHPQKSIVWQYDGISNFQRPDNDFHNNCCFCSGNDKTYYWTVNGDNNTHLIEFIDNGGYGDNSGSLNFYVYEMLNPVVQFSTSNGCDSVAVLNLTINQSDTSFTNITACDSVFWGGQWYDSSGTYYSNSFSNNNFSMSFDGLDDFISCQNNIAGNYSEFSIEGWINVDNFPNFNSGKIVDIGGPNSRFIVETKSNQSLHFEISENNILQDGLASVYGLQSNEWIHFAAVWDSDQYVKIFIDGNEASSNIIPPNFTSINISSQAGIFFGSRYSNSDFFDGLVDRLSIWGKALNEIEIQNLMNCPPDGSENELYGLWNFEEGIGSIAYDHTLNGNDGTLNGATYDTSVAVQSCQLLNSTNCDSVAVLNLIINNSSSTVVSVTACDSYIWDGVTYTASGQYTNVYTGSNNCDSTVTLDLTINFSSSNTITVTACDNFVWDGVTYTTSGQYTNVYTGSNNCDSTVTLDLTINYSSTNTVTVTACDSYVWDGVTYTTSGQYTNAYTGSNNCDSTVLLNLTINNSFFITDSVTICDGFSVSVGSSIYDSTGNYLDTLQTVGGCDSVINTILDVLNISIIQNDTSICYGDSVTLSVPANSTNSQQVCNLNQLPTNLQNGLVAYYPFCGNANDISNNGNHGIVNGTTLTDDRFGNINSAYDFDGSSHISVPHNSSLNFGLGSYTLSCWINCTGSNTYQHAITKLDYQSGSTNSTIYLRYENNSIAFTSSANSINKFNLISNPTSKNIWKHLVAVYNSLNDSVYIYIDGVIDKVSAANNIVNADNNDDLLFGVEHATISLPSGPQYLTGKLDDIGIWNRTLTSQEIQELYSNVSNPDIVWSTGDTTNSITVSPSQTTTYTVNQNGCTESITVTVLDTSLNTFNTSACDSYVWDGVTYTTSGQYTNVYTGSNNCDSTVTLDLTINYSSSNTVTVTACDSYVWDGVTYTVSGQYTNVYTGSNNCDSTVTLDLTINYSSSNTVTVTACDNFVWDGVTYTASGQYTNVYTGSNNCDSTVTLDLTINYSSSNTVTVTACDSYVWDGVTYTVSGQYTNVYTGSNNCDSTVTLDLTINYSSSNTVTVTACDNFVWDGVTYDSTGQYTNLYSDQYGCDSTVTLNLTINYSSSNTVTVTACDSYVWDGVTYTVSGQYTNVYTGSNNCDSTVTLDLTINYSSSNTVTVTACDNFVWDGVTYDSTGQYTNLYSDQYGCDSTVTLDLTINYSSSNTVTVTACDSYVWDGVSYNSSGQYTNVYTGSNNCDSTVTLDLTINYSSSNTVTITACDDFVWDGVTYTVSGQYTNVYTGSNNCDSTVTLDLTINYSSSNAVTVTACDDFVWDGVSYNSSGQYTNVYTGSNNCDSTVTLDLTINYSSSNTVTITACDDFVWDGVTYTTSGQYTNLYSDQYGCDSTVTLNLTINYSSSNTVTVTACDSYVWDGVSYNSSGQYTNVYTGSNNCDSTVTLDLTINYSSSNTVTVTACDNFIWDGVTYDSTGQYTNLYSDQYGCDSTVTLDLTINYSSSNTVTVTACDNFVWDGVTYDSTGQYTNLYSDQYGCDSIVTLNLSIIYSVSNLVTVTACDNFIWDGVTYDSTGTYINIYPGLNGCDSIVTLDLIIYQVISIVDTQGICVGDSITIVNNTYNTPGSYFDTLFYSNSCDSIIINTIIFFSPTGCTDPTSFNYDPIAVCDDGSCFMAVYGCLDSNALNYYPGANIDDGTCVYAGCTDSNAINYNQNAIIDDGSCVYNLCSNPSPINLYANNITDKQASINWSNMNSNSCKVLKYFVRYREVGTIPWVTKSAGVGSGLCNIGLNTTTKILRNLSPSTTYEFKMKAFYCGATESNYSSPVLFTTKEPCPEMINLTAQTFYLNNNKVRFNWDTSGNYVFARILFRVDSIGSSWQTAGGFGVFYPNLSVNKYGMQAGEFYRAQGRTFCDSNITNYKSWWTPPIFWQQPSPIRFAGGSTISNLEIYPNPSRNKFNISFVSDEVQSFKLMVYNIIGEEIYIEEREEYVGEYIKQINLKNYPKGVYFLEIETNKGTINKKLILQ